MKNIFLITGLLLIASITCGQQIDDKNRPCQCKNEKYKICIRLKDSKTSSLQHDFVICAEGLAGLNGVYYNGHSFLIKNGRSDSTLFTSTDNELFTYHLYVDSGKLMIKLSVKTFDLINNNAGQTKIIDFPLIQYTLEPNGKKTIKKLVNFKKLEHESIKQMRLSFLKDKKQLNENKDFTFNYAAHMINLTNCFFNGDTESLSLIKQCKGLIKTYERGRLEFPPASIYPNYEILSESLLLALTMMKALK